MCTVPCVPASNQLAPVAPRAPLANHAVSLTALPLDVTKYSVVLIDVTGEYPPELEFTATRRQNALKFVNRVLAGLNGIAGHLAVIVDPATAEKIRGLAQ